MKNKRENRTLPVVVFLLMLMVFLSFPTTVYAASDTVSLSLPIEKKLVGDVPPKTEQFSFELKAKEKNTPLPAGCTQNSCTITITGAGTTNSGMITYDQPGDYFYTLKETTPAINNYTMDTAEYTIQVQITTDDAGNLSAELFAYQAGSSNKKEALVFTNRYQKTVTPTPPPGTSDSTNMTPWIALMIVSIAGVAGVLVLLTRKKTKKEQ